MNLSQNKIELLKKSLPDFVGTPLKKCFNVTGIEVCFYVYGKYQEKIIDFFHEYYKHFPSIKASADVVIHYLCPNNDFSNPANPYWDEDDWQYHVIKNEFEHFISQRDFVAKKVLKTSEYWAIGPLLNQASCDSTDNLVQYALGDLLIDYDILPLHGATISDGKNAFVFFGESGAGKSTLSNQCFNLDGFKILSGDQIYLKNEAEGLFAYPNTITIADFNRDHPGWLCQKMPVKAVIHLLKSPRTYSFKPLEFKEILPLILRETVYRADAVGAKSLLELILKLNDNKSISFGEMSYLKGESFLKRFFNQINYRG